MVGAVSGLAALALTALARTGRDAEVGLGVIADQLAWAVKRQWAEEIETRRLNDPYPLPVAWRTADAALTEPWDRLTGLADSWPGGPPGDPAQWPADEAGLAGRDAQIHEVFAHRVPTRRLVVLGAPGSGKTVLLIRLLQDLIERRQDGGPVPVLFSLASWDPAADSIEFWLAEQLRRSYPDLRIPAPAGTAPDGARPADRAQALLASGLVVPLLDGFDELPPALHAVALDALNRNMPARQPLVLSSRAVPYHTALTRPDATVRLNGAAGIQLLPLAPEDAAEYLRRDAGGPHAPAADRWNQVITQLGTDTPVGQALSTPFGLFLARTIYNPRPQATAGPHPHPDELCDTTAYPDRTALDTHLLHAYIPAVYSPRHPNPSPWAIPQALRTLTFLARHLEHHRDGTPDLAWWELRHALSSRPRRLVYSALCGIGIVLSAFLVTDGPPLRENFTDALALVLVSLLMPAARRTPGTRPALALRALAFGLTFGILFATLANLLYLVLGTEVQDWGVSALVGMAVGGTVLTPMTFVAWIRTGTTPKARVRWHPGSIRIGLLWVPVLALLGLAVGGLAAGGFTNDSEILLGATVLFGFVLGIPAALVHALIRGFRSVPSDLTTGVGAAALLARDRRICLMSAPIGGLIFGGAGLLTLSFYAMISQSVELEASEPKIMIPLAVTVAIGLLAGISRSAWVDFVESRAYLAVGHKLPWRLMSFLQDAHEHRGVLRQIGTVYQFRHIELQRHLAQQPWPPSA